MQIIKSRPTTLRAAKGALIALSLVFLAEMLDNTIFMIALPTVARSLRASATDIQWISGIYPLVFGCLLLLFGSLADRFGRRKMMLTGLSLFGAASLCVLLVRTPFQLVLLRGLIGAAAAMTAPNTMALSYRLFDDDDLRVRATSLISNIGMIGFVAGPIIGGLLLAITSWRTLLLINVPVAILAWFWVHRGIPADDSNKLHQVPIDWLGATLGTLSIGLMITSLSFGVEHGWTDWSVITAASTALLAAVGFVRHERKTAHPMLDMGLLTRPGVLGGVINQVGLMMAMMAIGYLSTLLFQFVFGWTAFEAALGNLPRVLTMLVAGTIVNRLIKKLGMGSSSRAGGVLVAISLLLFALLADHGYIWIGLVMVLSAIGMRLVMVTSAISVMKSLPKNRTSIGSALSDTGQEFGSSIGIAIVGTILATATSGLVSQGGLSAASKQMFYSATTISCLVVMVLTIVALVIGVRLMKSVESQSAGPNRIDG